MWLIELINVLDNLLYHELPSDFVPGRTPICQDPRVEVSSLHPVLLSKSIEGAIIAKLRFYDVTKAAKGIKQRSTILYLTGPWSIRVRVASLEV